MTFTSALAPTRISLFGGGTDLPVYFGTKSGVVTSIAINIRQNVVVGTDGLGVLNLPEKGNPKFYEKIIRECGVENFSISSYFEGRIESGLGSSASAAVALVAACGALKENFLNREEIAEKAWDIEVNRLCLYGGKQDQYAASFGGMNTMFFSNNEVKVIPWPKHIGEKIAKNIILVDTNLTRNNTKIQEQLLSLTKEQEEAMDRIRGISIKAIELIQSEDIENLGNLLHLSWVEKQKTNPLATTEKINQMFETAISNGAYGGKLCGSGGGGHMFFICPEESQEKVKTALKVLGCTPIDFSIDWNGVETKRHGL